MQPYSSSIDTVGGSALRNASVAVKLNGALATIYALDGTPQANPMTTDSTGSFSFRAANGEYTLEITRVGIVPRTVTVQLYDPADERVTQAGTGAVPRTVQDKLRETVSAEDFYLAAESDQTGMIQRAIDAMFALGGGVVELTGSDSYTVSGITLKDGVILEGRGKRATTIQLASGANQHTIQAGDFDTYANGTTRATPVGCRSGGLRKLCIDSNKAGQSSAKHGLAYYGIDIQLDEVEFKNAKGINLYVESPGGTYSSVVGQNLQANIRHIECHDAEVGNLYFNGQSDSTIVDVMCYEVGTGAGQYNARFGSKAPGCRVFGMHCWGASDYALINEGAKAEFIGCHMESAAVAKIYAKARTIFRGQIYEVSAATAAPAIKLEDGTGANFSEFDVVISGCLEWIAFPSTVPSLCRFVLRGWVPGAAFYSGTPPTTTILDLENQATGARTFQKPSDTTLKTLTTTGALTAGGAATFNGTATFNESVSVAAGKKLTASGGIDLNTSGFDRAKFIAGNGWSAATIDTGVVSVASSFAIVSSASAVDVTDITSTAAELGILQVMIRNSGAGAVTFKHNINKLRNNTLADKVLNQYESITYTHVSGAVWQQTAGK